MEARLCMCIGASKMIDWLHSLIPYSPGDPDAHGLHVVIGVIIQWLFSRVDNDLIGFFVVLLLAVGKEVYDLVIRKEKFDIVDVLATMAGATLIIIFSR